MIVAKATQTVSFTEENTITKAYGDANFTNVASTSGNGTITYTSSNTNVAEVNQNTGEVTIVGVGEATITATASSTDLQDEAEASYTVIVAKATQTVYLVIEGDKQIYTIGNGTDFALFKINADFAKFQNGGSLYVDSVELSKQYYVAEPGSTVIKILDSCLDTLAIGEHSLTVYFDDGLAIASFTIVRESTDNNDGDKEIDKNDDEFEKNSIAVPDTGDYTDDYDDMSGSEMVVLPTCLIFIFSFALIVLKRKRIHKKFD